MSSIATIEMYKSIKVYPTFSSCPNKHQISVDAPICESDDGLVAYVNSESKKKWLNGFYAKEQRERYKDGKRGYSNKNG